MLGQYVSALHYQSVIKEVLIGIKAFPHSGLVDSTFLGYHIPKDTLILANIWCIVNSITKLADFLIWAI